MTMALAAFAICQMPKSLVSGFIEQAALPPAGRSVQGLC
jgi:hypothetical protein